jgi:hypothetical protein
MYDTCVSSLLSAPTSLQALAAAADGFDAPGDGPSIVALAGVIDRLTAKLAGAVGQFDADGGWGLDAATSLQAWLRHHCTLAPSEAGRLARASRRLRSLPVTREAWSTGVLTGGHVQAVLGNVTERTVELYAEHETEVVPALADLTSSEAATVMRDWAAKADAVVAADAEPDAGPQRSLHLSQTLAGRWEVRGSFDAEGGALLATALRLAESDDDGADGGRIRLAAERRADAAVDLARWFADNQHGHRGGRHRPHLNVVVDYDDLMGRGQGRLLDGTPLDATTVERLACDAAVHRVVTAGRSTILDYGRATRTISPELWAALVLRDGGCRIPWCDRDSTWCDAHHIRLWSRGGPTNLANLVTLCSRHHHRLHEPGWHLRLLPDATVEVTTPDGTTHTGRPPPCAPSPHRTRTARGGPDPDP